MNKYLTNNVSKRSNILVFIYLFILSFIWLVPTRVSKATIFSESLPDSKVFNDFVVGPGKFEMELAPGQSGTFELIIANRLGTTKNFLISEEDFTGSDDPDQTVVLLGDKRGPYSLRDYIKFGTTSISIPHATLSRVPITVVIPKDAEPGGLYGSVMVSTGNNTEAQDSTNVSSLNKVSTRIGTLVFIKVKGEVSQDGQLAKFGLKGDKGIIFNTDPVTFNILYQNKGNVHLNPYGAIIVKNSFGTKVGNIDIEPWFAMPDSLRLRQVEWKPAFLFGRYTAYASIYRGYGDLKDEMIFSFWVIPWKAILGFIIGLAVLYFLVGLIRSKHKRNKLLAVTFFIVSLIGIAQGETMSSSNYKLENDSINFAGGRSESGSYIIEDTLGEVATGVSSSTNYVMKAGYQQNPTLMISVTPASDVTMSPSIPGLTGGTANGQTSFTVITDDPAGYMATMSADYSPALRSASDSFEDYIPAGLVPDYAFTNDSATSSFAFSPEGDDIAQRFKNSGLTCGVGSSDASDACWDGLSMDEVTIVNRTSSNQPAGTLSTIKFRAESGSNHVQLDGVYTATTTITVTAL